MGTKRVGLARVEALIENLKRDLALGGAVLSGLNANIINVAEATKALAATDSGATVLLNNGTTTTTVTLPAGSTISAGWNCQFVVLSDNTGAYVIKRGTNGELIKGRFPVVSTTADNTAVTESFATNDTLTLHADAADASQAGGAGSFVNCYWDGTAWQVWGSLISNHANPAGVAVFSNT